MRIWRILVLKFVGNIENVWINLKEIGELSELMPIKGTNDRVFLILSVHVFLNKDSHLF